MGSSLSRPVPCSMKPELRPLIWTRQRVSCWMCLTYAPPWPTTCARRLKPGIGSRSIGMRSSGHLRYAMLVPGIRIEVPRPHTRPYSSRSTCSGSLGRKRRSSTRLGSSCFIISSTLMTAFSRPSFEVLVMWRYSGGL